MFNELNFYFRDFRDKKKYLMHDLDFLHKISLSFKNLDENETNEDTPKHYAVCQNLTCRKEYVQFNGTKTIYEMKNIVKSDNEDSSEKPSKLLYITNFRKEYLCKIILLTCNISLIVP